jgi:CheY-like chemotaxis protein/nitrogen-specific signal transduction histidine kinase
MLRIITNTKLKMMQNIYELRREKDQAVVAKSQFLSAISHEVLTPMNAIIGFTELLLHTNPTTEQLGYLQAIKLSGDSLLMRLDDILDFSAIEKDEIKFDVREFKIAQLLDNIRFSFLEKATEKQLPLKLFVDQRLSGAVIGDPVRLEQILNNLISNAIKFTIAGEIRISATLLYSDGENSNIEFEIADTGIGIPEDKIAVVFESFTQADAGNTREAGGIGLGLTIAKKLIEMQGGSISVNGKSGYGSVFKFNLTFKKGIKKPAEQPKQVEADAADSLKGAKILVAEDNEINIMLVKNIMKLWDVECDVVRDGLQAVEKVKTTDYDMILMDLQMPVMDGYEATSIIRQLPMEKAKTLPIVAFTASSKFEIESNAAKAGLNDYIGKPFDLNELYAKIKMYSNKY